MPFLAAAFVAGSFAFLPFEAPAAIEAIQIHGPRRLDISYEGYVPLPVIGTRIKAANANVSAWIGPQSYNIVSRAEAAGMVGWFVTYNLNLSSTGAVTPTGLKPGHYDSMNKDGKKNRHVVVDFAPGEAISTVTPHFGDWGFPPATQQQRAEAMDPLSAIVQLTLAADATAENPCGGPFRAYDGKQRYDLKMTFTQRVAFKSAAYTGPAIQCSVEYTELAGFKQKTEAQKAKDKADIEWTNLYLADLDNGAVRPVLKLEAQSKSHGRIGIVATKLSWRAGEPAAAAPSPAPARSGG